MDNALLQQVLELERIKTFAFVTLVIICGVHIGNFQTSSWSPKENFRSDLDITTGSKRLQKSLDCADIFEMGHKKSGIYEIWPINRVIGRQSVHVYCDMDTNGGGWTVIQRRGEFGTPKDYFYQNWESYKKGFGKIEEDFWLGNDKIFALTNQKYYSVRFDLIDVEENKRYAFYNKFWIDDEKNNYTLHISQYTGDAGDSMTYHNNQRFSTFDKDNDNRKDVNCAEKYKGAWWHVDCYDSNLNGLYHKGKHAFPDGISWIMWKGYLESLKWTEIKIRPIL